MPKYENKQIIKQKQEEKDKDAKIAQLEADKAALSETLDYILTVLIPSLTTV